MHFKKYIVMSQRNCIWDCQLHNQPVYSRWAKKTPENIRLFKFSLLSENSKLVIILRIYSKHSRLMSRSLFVKSDC